jgi:aminoglycoside/choline kinase family phosphotransferase
MVGRASAPRNGIYAMPREGKPRLLLHTPRFAQYLWGG